MRQRPSLDEIFAQPMQASRPSLDEIFAQPVQPESKSFLQNVEEDMRKRGANLANISDRERKGQQSELSSSWQRATNLVGSAGDIAGNAIASAAKTGYEALPENWQNSLNAKAKEFVASPIGQFGLNALKTGGEKWNKFEQSHPEAAFNIKGLGDLITGLPGVAAEKAAAKGAMQAPELAAEGLARGAAKVLPAINEDIRPIAQKAMDYNIPLSRTQIGESEPAKIVASATGKIPFSGARAFQQEQQKAFNREVLDTIGAKGDKVTPELLSKAGKEISQKFDNALKGQQIKIAPEVLSGIQDIKAAAIEKLGPGDATIVAKQADKLLETLSPKKGVDELLGIANKENTIPGEKLGAIRSDLSEMTKNRGKDTPYIRQLKDLVQEASVAGAPQRKADLQDAIEKFRHYQVIKPLLGKAVRGDISPSLLLARVDKNYPDFARGGGGKLGDLARIGKAFLKDPIPDSGTAQRSALYRGLEGLAGGAAGTYAATTAPQLLTGVALPVAFARGFNSANTSQRFVKASLRKGLK